MGADQFTRDALFGGALSIRQPARRTGYRVNVDALLLAAFAAQVLEGGEPPARSSPAKRAIDLGAGVGAVGLTLLHLGAARRVTMIEIDATLAELATANAEDNGFSDKVDVVHADVKDAAKNLLGDGDLVVCNPPYVAPGRGRAPLERVRSAKYGDVTTFVDAARKIAGRRARVSFVYPAIEATTLLTALRGRGLEPKRLRAVHGRAGDKARIVLIDAAPQGKAGGLVIEPPFIEMEGRSRSAALTKLLTTPPSAR